MNLIDRNRNGNNTLTLDVTDSRYAMMYMGALDGMPIYVLSLSTFRASLERMSTREPLS